MDSAQLELRLILRGLFFVFQLFGKARGCLFLAFVVHELCLIGSVNFLFPHGAAFGAPFALSPLRPVF